MKRFRMKYEDREVLSDQNDARSRWKLCSNCFSLIRDSKRMLLSQLGLVPGKVFFSRVNLQSHVI